MANNKNKQECVNGYSADWADAIKEELKKEIVKKTKTKKEPEVILCQFEDEHEVRCDKPAKYDARIDDENWAYLCEEHFKVCECELGIDKGMLITGQQPPAELTENKPETLVGKGCAKVNTLTTKGSEIVEIRADCGVSLDIGGVWFKFNYGETRRVVDGADTQQEKINLWHDVNEEITNQVNKAYEEN